MLYRAQSNAPRAGLTHTTTSHQRARMSAPTYNALDKHSKVRLKSIQQTDTKTKRITKFDTLQPVKLAA